VVNAGSGAAFTDASKGTSAPDCALLADTADWVVPADAALPVLCVLFPVLCEPHAVKRMHAQVMRAVILLIFKYFLWLPAWAAVPFSRFVRVFVRALFVIFYRFCSPMGVSRAQSDCIM
jgi:hypothetical protein